MKGANEKGDRTLQSNGGAIQKIPFVIIGTVMSERNDDGWSSQRLPWVNSNYNTNEAL